MRPPRRPTLIVTAAAAVFGTAAGIGYFLGNRHATPDNYAAVVTPPPVSWPAGTRKAPDFTLRDQRDVPISLRAFRGQTTIVTFLDPLCRNICPLEARVLADAIRHLPQGIRPALIAVSVNPHGDTHTTFRADARHWRLTPSWRWAIGSHAQLAAVWRKYDIQVKVATKRLAGVTVGEVEHGEAAYIIDRSGYERAMFLYPFTSADLEREIRAVDAAA